VESNWFTEVRLCVGERVVELFVDSSFNTDQLVVSTTRKAVGAGEKCSAPHFLRPECVGASPRLVVSPRDVMGRQGVDGPIGPPELTSDPRRTNRTMRRNRFGTTLRDLCGYCGVTSGPGPGPLAGAVCTPARNATSPFRARSGPGRVTPAVAVKGPESVGNPLRQIGPTRSTVPRFIQPARALIKRPFGSLVQPGSSASSDTNAPPGESFGECTTPGQLRDLVEGRS
jgi:hypothetical protein